MTSTTNTSNTGEFDVESFEQKLATLKDTQDGIQQMSAWCLQQRAFHKKIVSSWLNVLKQVRVEHRLTLFYLANDVIQYSKRKNYEFVESWGTALQKATTMVRDEKVRNKIFRIFKIWEQREIYSEEYLSDLNGLLSMNPVKKTQQTTIESSDDFQNSILISNIRECVKLEKNTDKNFKNLPKAPNCDIETIKNNLKDRSHSDDAEKDIDEFVHALEVYIKSLKSEIRSRKLLINHIVQADTFYTNQRGEVKVVVNAYRNFGNRIKVVKKKLDEITPNLPSPIPSPDINAPSPEQDADIVLPDDQNSLSINMFKNSSNGYTSYMDGNLPFDINDFKRESPKKQQSSYEASTAGTQQIQVINNRSEQKSESNYDFFKSNDGPYTPMDVPVPVAPPSNYATLNQQSTGAGSYSNNSIVGGGYSNNAPPPSNYGDPYNDSTYTATSTNPSYDTQMPLMPPPMPPLLGVASDDFNSTWDMDMTWTSINSNNSFNSSIDTPVSPPHFEREGVNPDLVEYMEGEINDEIVPIQDVDHRQLHIPQTPSVKMSLSKEKVRTIDVDHRNLISLTGSPGPRSFENKKKSNSPPKLNPFQKQSEIDIDYRRKTLVGDIDYRTQIFQQQQQQQQQQQHQGRMQILQEIPTDVKSSNIQDVIKEIRTTVALQQQAASSKEAKSNSADVTESPSILMNSSKEIVEKNSGSDKQQNQFILSEPPPPGTTLHPPPPLPSLDASLFPVLNTFLSPPPAFNSSLAGEQSQSKEGNASDTVVVTSKKCGRDNVESIDMDMSDEDLDDQKKDNSQQSNLVTVVTEMANDVSSTALLDSIEDESALIQAQTNQRPPLLQTPDMQQWTRPTSVSISTESDGDMNSEMLPMMWKSRIPGTPPFRMPPTAIQQQPQQFPRSHFMQPPRGFSPQMKQNFRDQMYMGGSRNSPYFNNRGGRFGNGGRSRSHRGGFRGSKNWQ